MTDADPADPDLEARKRRVGIVVALVVVGLVIGGGMWFAASAFEAAVAERRARGGSVRAPRAGRSAGEDGVLEFVVVLARPEGASGAVVRIGNETLGLLSDPATVEAIRRHVMGAVAAVPAGTGGRVTARIADEPGVPYEDVLRAIDVLIAAGIKDIAVPGAPPEPSPVPGGDGR